MILDRRLSRTKGIVYLVSVPVPVVGRGSVRAVARDVISARPICPRHLTRHGSDGASPYPFTSP